MGTHPWGEAQPSLEQDCCAQFSWGTTWAQHPPHPPHPGSRWVCLGPGFQEAWRELGQVLLVQ